MKELLLSLGVLALASVPAWAQESRCANCHFANPSAPNPQHLDDWDRSAHGRASVGCETCHGGNPATFEPFQAHQGILHRTNPASPINRLNLTATCGKCHAGPVAAFQKSQHYTLLRGGDRNVPSCTTCHGEVAAHLLSPKSLQSQCASCHGAGRTAPNTDFPAQGRMLLENIRDARELLKEANSFIRRITNAERRASLEREAQQAQLPLTQATEAGHAFVFGELEQRLGVARQRIATLFEKLVMQ